MHVSEFREVIKYKKRVTGKDLVEKGLDPKDDSKLNEVFGELEEEELEIRFDPLFGRKNSLHTAIITDLWVNKPIAMKVEEKMQFDISSCVFCKPKIFLETCVPKIFHKEEGVVSFPNAFPFLPSHYITVLCKEHKQNLGELEENEIRAFLLSGRDLAKKFKDERYDGMFDYFQVGHLSSVTQPHLHAQRSGREKYMNSLIDKEALAIEKRKKELLGEDPFEWYFEFIRKNDLLIYEDDFVFACAPFAPRFMYQIDIFTKKVNRKIVSNYLELSDSYIASISKIIAQLLQKLNKKLGINNLSVDTHQALFSKGKSFRMHWHIYPRRRPTGTIELNNLYISNVCPEETAKILREE